MTDRRRTCCGGQSRKPNEAARKGDCRGKDGRRKFTAHGTKHLLNSFAWGLDGPLIDATVTVLTLPSRRFFVRPFAGTTILTNCTAQERHSSEHMHLRVLPIDDREARHLRRRLLECRRLGARWRRQPEQPSSGVAQDSKAVVPNWTLVQYNAASCDWWPGEVARRPGRFYAALAPSGRRPANVTGAAHRTDIRGLQVRTFRRRSPRAADRPSLVFVQDAPYESGGTRFAHRVVQVMRGHGANASMAVLTDPDDDVRRFTTAPEIPVRFASPDRKRFREAAPRVVVGYASIVRSADVVVSASEVGYTMILGVVLARVFRKPFVALVQSPLDQSIAAWHPARLRPLVAWANRHVDLAACVSTGVYASVLANGLPAERAVELKVGADPPAVLQAGRTVVAPPPGGPPRLVAMGRLEPVKGFDILIRASALLKSRGRPHEILIVGDGTEREALQTLANDLDVSEHVSLLGFVANPQPLLAGADAFVLSSRFEGSGGTVLFEALTHGVPVIATDCFTGPRVALADGKCGDLVAVADPEALANAIESFLTDPVPLRLKAAGGPARAAEFDQAAAAGAFYQHLQERFLGTASPGETSQRPPNIDRRVLLNRGVSS